MQGKIRSLVPYTCINLQAGNTLKSKYNSLSIKIKCYKSLLRYISKIPSLFSIIYYHENI